tara:strand:- start:1050 stop:1256 length:207 start_codon:yes stop_codon:yes gene_type:complete
MDFQSVSLFQRARMMPSLTGEYNALLDENHRPQRRFPDESLGRALPDATVEPPDTQATDLPDRPSIAP